MKIGLGLPNFARWFRGEAIWAVCEKAKEMNIDALFFVDHIIFTPQQYVGYGNGYMDIWTAMTYVAAVTNVQGWKPTLGQGICVIPYRPPIVQAKIAATLDSLSGGRLLIGAGSGYNDDEFGALGLNVRERGDMTHEYLACMKELWEHPVASFHGKYVNFDEMTISVRPAQQHIPIIYGASGPRPFRMIAERYDGWIPGPLRSGFTLGPGVTNWTPGTGTVHAGGREPSGGETDYFKVFEKDWAELNRLWKSHGRQGKPFLVLGAGGHLTTDRSAAGEEIVKGVIAPGQRTYISRRTVTHVDDVVARARRCADLGADIVNLGLVSYRYGEFDNQGMLLNQMEMLAEHVLPKLPRG